MFSPSQRAPTVLTVSGNVPMAASTYGSASPTNWSPCSMVSVLLWSGAVSSPRSPSTTYGSSLLSWESARLNALSGRGWPEHVWAVAWNPAVKRAEHYFTPSRNSPDWEHQRLYKCLSIRTVFVSLKSEMIGRYLTALWFSVISQGIRHQRFWN